MSNQQQDNLFVPSLHRRGRPPSPSPLSEEEPFNFMDSGEDNRVTLRDITHNNILARQGVTSASSAPPLAATMPTVEEQLEEFRRLAERQAQQLEQQNNNMAQLQAQHIQSQAAVA